MFMRAVAIAAGVAVLCGCARNVEVQSGGDVAAAMPVNENTLPMGTTLRARLNQTLSTEGNKVGDAFTLTVTDNVVAQNGAIVVPAGATVHGRVTALQDSDNPTERAVIGLQFERLVFNGRTFEFGASVQRVETVEQRNPQTGEVIRKAGTGAAVGAAIGAIVSGAELDAIIKGGLAGAAVGTVISLGLGDVDHVIPAGTAMTIQATQTVALR